MFSAYDKNNIFIYIILYTQNFPIYLGFCTVA